MSTPQRPNQPVPFDEAEEILGSKPGQETVPDAAETVASENLGRSDEEFNPSDLEAAPRGGLEGYRPEGAAMVANPDYGRFEPEEARECTLAGKQWKIAPLDVFPPEERRLLTSTSYPWLCAGRVTNSDGKGGSGVLVGDRVLLTARHLRPSVSIGRGSWWMKFVPHSFDDSEPFGSSYVSTLHRPEPSGPHFDMMVGRLNEPLGQRIGYFGVQEWDDDWDGRPHFATIGYPGVFGGARPFFQTSCSGEEFDSEKDAVVVTTRADLTEGNSGGPFWTLIGAGLDPRVVGVVTAGAFANDERMNLVTSGDLLERLVSWARSNWPA